MQFKREMLPIWFIATILIILSIGSFTLPFVLAQSPKLINLFPQGNLPDYINGISTPILYLLTSLLLFFSFREQHIANRLLRKQVKETLEEIQRKHISEQIEQFEHFLDKIGCIYGTLGNNILQTLFCTYINNVNHQNESNDYKYDPEKHFMKHHTYLYFAIQQFERLFTTVFSIEDRQLKEYAKQKLLVLFHFYFRGALTIEFFQSRFLVPGQQDYIQSINEKLRYWNSSLVSRKE